MKSGRTRKANRKARGIDALTTKPREHLQVFSDPSEKERREDARLLSKAISGLWDVSERTKSATMDFILSTLEDPNASDDLKVGLVQILIRIEYRNLREVKSILAKRSSKQSAG